jgi:hypothetical protein
MVTAMEDMIMATDIIAIPIATAPIITVMDIPIVTGTTIIVDQDTDPVMGDEIMG